MRRTYVDAMQKASYDMAVAGFQQPGMTPEERAARIQYARILAAVDIMNAVGAHYQFMNSNPSARCFADAYEADIKVGNAFIEVAEKIYESEGGTYSLDPAFAKRDTFLARFDEYFADCR